MEEIKNWYLGLTNSQKQIFLASVGHQLTVHARQHRANHPKNPDPGALLRVFTGMTELHHHLSHQVVAIGMDRGRYADSLLWDILISKATDFDLTKDLMTSLDYARNSMTVVSRTK